MEVYVILERILEVVNPVVVGEEVLASSLEHPCLMADVEVHEVGDLRRTPTDIHVGALVVGHVLEDLFVPVHVRILIRISASEGVADVVFGIECIACTLVPYGLIVHAHVGLSTSCLRYVYGGIDIVLDTYPDDGTL